MDSHIYSRPALGANAKLGDLYDCRSDTFMGKGIFKENQLSLPVKVQSSLKPFRNTRRADAEKNSPWEPCTFISKHSTNTKVLQGDKISDKLNHLCINDFMGVNVLGGLISLEGSGQYLQTGKRHTRDLSYSKRYQYLTKHEKINIYDQRLKNIIDIVPIKNSGATHFLAEITWGANLFMTVTHENWDGEDELRILDEFEELLEGLELSEIEFVLPKTPRIIQNPLLQFECDVLPKTKFFQNLRGAHSYVSSFKNAVKETNNGNGKQINYILVPLIFLKNQHGVEIEIETTTKLSAPIASRIIQLFDKIEIAKQLLNEFDVNTADSKHRLTRESVKRIQNLEAQFRKEFGLLLHQVNCGEKPAGDLKALVENHEEIDFSPLIVICDMENHFPKADNEEKLQAYSTLLRHKVTLISMRRGLTLHDFINAFSQQYRKEGIDTYIFFEDLPTEAAAEGKDIWRKQFHLFLSFIKKCESVHNSTIFVYVKTDSCSNPAKLTSTIHRYNGGKCLATDAYRNARRIFSFRPTENKVLSIFTF